MQVLLVDDEKELVSTLAERLRMRGIDADWATSAEDAIAAAAAKPYDLAVLDVKMPRADGIRLKRLLAKDHPGMRFIFMTGHGSQESRAEGMAESGEAFYLAKPVAIDVLIAKMKDAMQMQGDT